MNNTNKTKELEKKDRVYVGFVALYITYCLIRNIMNPFSYSFTKNKEIMERSFNFLLITINSDATLSLLNLQVKGG